LSLQIGHLEGAAGLAGVIKCILMLEKGVILPNIHFDKPNKRIPFNEWKIKVPTDIISWPKHRPQRASVNSFGYGGTNAHVILDSADQFIATAEANVLQDELEIVTNKGQTKLFIFSAPAESALRRMMERTRDHLLEVESNTQTLASGEEKAYLDRLAFTLSDRRSQFPWKAVVVADTLSELAEALSTSSSLAHSPKKPRIAFVFTGQGAQWARMGIELWEYGIFRESVQNADTYLKTCLGSDWSVTAEFDKSASASCINRAQISQPLCTVLQIALVDLLKSWRIEPTAVVGHSSGEIAAAYCCGALTREDAWSVAYHRGKACSDLDKDPAHVKGAMMAVGLSAEAARHYIRDVKAGTVVVACVNSPSSVTISGDASGIDELQVTLTTKGVFCRKLQVEHAYHSHHMKRVADAYLQHISSIRTKEASPDNTVHMVSSVTGKSIKNEQLGPDYWVQNFVSPVLFTDAVSTLLQDPTRRRRRARSGESAFDILLEVGPHSALKGPLRQILQHNDISAVTYASILLRGEDAVRSAIRAVGELCIHGVSINVSQVNSVTTKPKPLEDLPSYPFDHSLRYWSESRLSRNYLFRRFGRHDLLGAPAADASANQPRWRNILRVQEQPWLKDHMVHSSILYPASGSLVMVLEAVQQLTVDRKIESIKLEQVRITKAIVIPNDQAGIETVLQLHRDEESDDPSQDSWQFFVLSCSDGTALEQNSSGRVTVRYMIETEQPTAAWTTGKNLLWQAATKEYNDAVEQCTRSIDPAAFYIATWDAGLQYGPQFQGLVNIDAGSDRCATIVDVTDTKASMPGAVQSPHLIHPTTLDVIFHSMFTAMGKEGLDFSNAAVPIAFDSLIFYMDLPSSPGSQFRGCCNINRDGSRDLVADIYVSDINWKEPKIIVNGIRCRELPPSDAGSSSRGLTKAPVGTLVWKPDIAFLDEARLKRYILLHTDKPASWEAEVGVVSVSS
jgi:acyl transferase domain-containing protein